MKQKLTFILRPPSTVTVTASMEMATYSSPSTNTNTNNNNAQAAFQADGLTFPIRTGAARAKGVVGIMLGAAVLLLWTLSVWL